MKVCLDRSLLPTFFYFRQIFGFKQVFCFRQVFVFRQVLVFWQVLVFGQVFLWTSFWHETSFWLKTGHCLWTGFWLQTGHCLWTGFWLQTGHCLWTGFWLQTGRCLWTGFWLQTGFIYTKRIKDIQLIFINRALLQVSPKQNIGTQKQHTGSFGWFPKQEMGKNKHVRDKLNFFKEKFHYEARRNNM